VNERARVFNARFVAAALGRLGMSPTTTLEIWIAPGGQEPRPRGLNARAQIR
jgi:hypothetical protein